MARKSKAPMICARRCCAVLNNLRRRLPKGCWCMRPVVHSDTDDMPAVRRIVRAAAPGDYKFSSLVQSVVRSEQFKMRRVPQPAVARAAK